jgi:DNA-binding CsgD family transcriptional regulator
LPLLGRINPTIDETELVQAISQAILSAMSASPLIVTLARVGLSLLAFSAGDTASAQDQYTALARQHGTMVQTGAVSVDRVLGLLAYTMADFGKAQTHFEDSLVFCRKAGYRCELAWTYHDYAQALLHRGIPSEHTRAISLLEEALTISRDSGLRSLMERIAYLKAQLLAQPAPPHPDGLTRREVEILRLMAAGKRNLEIADELVLSLRTVAHHVTSILNKTNSTNRTGAAAYASRHKLVSLTED